MIQIRQLDLTFGAPQASAPTVQNVPEHRSEPSRLERSEGMGNLGSVEPQTWSAFIILI